MRAPTPTPGEPQLPPELERRELTLLGHDESFAEIEAAGFSLIDQNAKGVTFQVARLTDIDLSGSRLEHLRVLDGALSRCNLANVRARHADAERVVIETSRLTGIDLAEGVLTDVTFRDSRIDLASFGFSRLKRVSFEDCALSQTDFLEARLDSVRFSRCDLSEADLRGARMTRCELRDCELAGIHGVEGLRGAAMELSDIVAMAGVWAAALGIETLDPDQGYVRPPE
jgi:uncharacterized protein YjbI with pentapeptide repeats